MVDFAKLRRDAKHGAPTDPAAIFQRLPKPPHINDLWDGQSKALAAWYKRREEADLVLKLNTGGGKTLVGLLIAQSLLNEFREPVLYLCPTKQLVDQTLEKASEVGLTAVSYGGREIDADFLNATKILVGPYHALFNGLSKFGVLNSGKEPIRLGGIVCDDAHAALGVIRTAFTLSINRAAQTDLYETIAGRFRHAFDSAGRLGTFDDILEHEDFAILEVPYPAWLAQSSEIRQLIARDHSDTFRFELPLLRDYFHLCHALISAKEVSITPFQPLIHLFPSFKECRHRLYMSATIADDSSIVRTFDANPKLVSDPIVPSSLAGVGERMILAPSLMEIDRTPLSVSKGLAKIVAKNIAGVVILTQSEYQAKQWADTAQIAMGDDVALAVKELKTDGSRGPFVFPGRYDGLDLAGNACRLLILDRLPLATNTYELYRAEVLRGNSSINVGLAQRIEQAIGRGTRGAGDYCVVLLVGEDLTAWIARSASLALMTSATRAQVQMGYEISKSIRNLDELVETVDQCLKRDKAWVRYQAETLADTTEQPRVDNEAIDIAHRERIYIDSCLANAFDKAIQILRQVTDGNAGLDRHARGWLLQLEARAAYYSKQDRLASELQGEAFAANNLLLPPPVKPVYEPIVEVGEQVANILSEVTRFALRKGALDEFERNVSFLAPTTTSNQFEEALKRLGELLGFYGQRPESQFREGPDVLWLSGKSRAFVIECKHRKDLNNALTKDEYGQFLTSMAWAKEKYSGRELVGFIVHLNLKATKQSAAHSANALTLERLGGLIGAARQFYTELCSSVASAKGLEKECAELVKKYALSDSEIEKRYLQLFQIT